MLFRNSHTVARSISGTKPKYMRSKGSYRAMFRTKLILACFKEAAAVIKSVINPIKWVLMVKHLSINKSSLYCLFVYHVSITVSPS